MTATHPTITQWSRPSKSLVLFQSLPTTSTIPPPSVQLPDMSATLDIYGTGGLTTLSWRRTRSPARRTAPGRRTGQPVQTSPSAPTPPASNIRTRLRQLGRRATPRTTWPRSRGSAKTGGSWSNGLGTKQPEGRQLKMSASGIQTTPSYPRTLSVSSHIAIRWSSLIPDLFHSLFFSQRTNPTILDPTMPSSGTT